jgi:HK97 family phage prohead protease
MSARISNDGWELRYLPGEVRAAVEGRKIRGLAIVFDSRSVDLGGFTEIIKPSAVDRTIREGLDVRALVNHIDDKVLGRTTAGTLALRKTRKGLEVEIDPDQEISYARDIMRSVERGDVTGMSFRFRTIEDDWHMEDGDPVREVMDMTVNEVSIVTFPAYPATDVQVAQRSLQQFRETTTGSRLEFLRKRLRNRSR